LCADKMTSYLVKNRTFVIVAVILGACYFTWWLSFFPGMMSPDSITHWLEATSFHFSNASPYLYSLILAGLIKIWDTPAMMGLFQVLLLTTTVSLFINYSVKRGIDKKLLILLTAFFALYPAFGVLNITIWKDVLYSYLILIVLLLSVLLVIDRELRQKRYFLWVLPFLIPLIPLLRFNGFVFFIFVPVLLIWTQILSGKKIIAFLAIQLGVYAFFSIFLFNLLQVAPAPLIQEGIYVKLVGAIYHMESPNLTENERVIFQTLMPEKTWKEYYLCISVDQLFYKGLAENIGINNAKPISPDPTFVSKWHKAVIAATLRNPGALIYDKACMGSYLLGIKNIFYKYQDGIYLSDQSGPVHSVSKFPLGQKVLYKYLYLSSAGTADGYGISQSLFAKIINLLLWSAVVPLTAYAIYGFLAIKHKMRGLGSYVILMALNIIAVIALVPAASFRYVYVLFVAAPFLPIIYLLESGTLPSSAKK